MKDEHPFRNKIAQQSLWALVATSFSRIGGLLFTIILARFLMPAGFGLYSLAFSIAILFITFADVGINQTLIRYVSASIGKENKKASRYFNYIFSLKIKAALISSLILLLSSYLISNIFLKKPELFPLLIILSLYVFLTAIQNFYESLFYTNDGVSKIALKEAIFQVLRISSVLAIFFVISIESYVIGAIFGSIFSALLILIFLYLIFKKSFNFQNGTLPSEDKKTVLKVVALLSFSSLGGILFSYMDTLIMGLFFSYDYIGLYRASISLVIAIGGAMSFPGVFLSAFTKIKENNLQESFDKVIRTISIISIPASVGLVVLSSYFLVFIFGYEYLAATKILYILSPLIFLFVNTSIFSSILTSREKAKDLAVLTIFSALLNIALNLTAIKIFLPYSQDLAVVGVAIATVLSWFFYFVVFIFVLRRSLNIRFRFKYLIKPVISSIIMAFFLFSLQIISQDMNIFKGLITVSGGALIYFASLGLIGGLKKDDLIMAKSFLKKFNPLRY